ncbi:UDP-N-acetylmuramate dehydrogenase [Fulvivirga lutimaris]|uniref:UDP-N-acetylmuramate dehydrogenase n=1 Tax=Fulvivirga lutimaris TaxID=1819566 RepID=UPI001627F7F6|nr:UDP-N-acetylmuramate dehydrogenase [Fulvivirga lutimaris]
MTIQKEVSLKSFNTFGLESHAALFMEVHSIAEMQSIITSETFKNNEVMILGGGSNILLTRDFNGLVIRNQIAGIEIISEDEDHVFVKVGGGEVWHEFVLHAIDHNWGGIENLSLIPGTVGAAPMQNIGAYGIEIKEVFESLTAVDLKTGETRLFNKQECQFGYRESIFKLEVKGQYFIADVTFKLTKSNHKINTSYGAIKDVLNERGISNPTIKDVSDAVISIRQSKLPDPKEIGNSGSFFKNPTIDKIDYEGLKIEFPDIPGYVVSDNEVKVPAGWLIEQCGWKGLKRGEIGVHKNQALVLVNYGGGKGNDIADLSKEIQQSVIDKFGIELTPEVNFI